MINIKSISYGSLTGLFFGAIVLNIIKFQDYYALIYQILGLITSGWLIYEYIKNG